MPSPSTTVAPADRSAAAPHRRSSTRSRCGPGSRAADGSSAGTRAHLTRLDAVLGDGDHGDNLVIGFRAVDELLAELPAATPPGEILRAVGHRSWRRSAGRPDRCTARPASRRGSSPAAGRVLDGPDARGACSARRREASPAAAAASRATRRSSTRWRPRPRRSRRAIDAGDRSPAACAAAVWTRA